jgi:hypothetical protein
MIFIKLKTKYDNKKQQKKHKEAVRKGLRMAVFVWETKTKILTTIEKHVITGRYRGSINLNTQDGFGHDPGPAKADDGIHEEKVYNEIIAGSNVEYAIWLEKRYGIFLRGLDGSRERMLKMFGKTYMENI